MMNNTAHNNREAQLLEKALTLLKQETGLTATIVAQEFHHLDYGRADALVRLGNSNTTHIVEIKRNLVNEQLGAVIQQFNHLLEMFEINRPQYKRMLITDYINPVLAEKLKEQGIAFLDMAGNAYINDPPLYIYIRGNKPGGKPQGQKRLTHMFAPTRLQVIFALLRTPALIDRPYRDIAAAADVALGTVGWVLADLRDQGYLLEAENTRKLVRTRELVHRWAEAYPVKLRPKLLLEKFTAADPYWWKDIDIRHYKAYWGGEIAAHKLTGYLKPAKATIYAHELPIKLIVDERLQKDPDGEIEILKIFWPQKALNEYETQWDQDHELVPNLLIYADLMTTADGRNIETATLIENDYLTAIKNQP